MIKPEELRVGNYFNPEPRSSNPMLPSLPMSEVWKVWEIKYGKISSYKNGEHPAELKEWKEWDYQELSPITLTEEWLLKFGFEFEDRRLIYKLLVDKLNEEYFCIKPDKNGFYHPAIEDGSHQVIYPHPYKRIKYVHQLQNLYYALTREELIF